MIQLMKHSGLAIRDAAFCNAMKLYMTSMYRMVTARAKTGVHISVPITYAVAKKF